jgi:hypothetical protein
MPYFPYFVYAQKQAAGRSAAAGGAADWGLTLPLGLIDNPHPESGPN